MTLRGSLTDLSLTEVLQLACLSTSSAVLSLSSSHGRAWIGIEAGAVVRVARDDGSLSPPKLLERAGFRAGEDARGAAEVIREAVIDALAELFEWTDGDFHLDASASPRGAWQGPEGAILDPPISSQVLMLEAARRQHEARPASSTSESGGGEEGARASACAVVAVGPDLSRLEELKAAIKDQIQPVHIFQLPEEGVQRVGQYLARGRFPLVIVDAGAGAWPESAGWEDVAERVRGMSPLIRIASLSDGDEDQSPWIDAVLRRPVTHDTMADGLEPEAMRPDGS